MSDELHSDSDDPTLEIPDPAVTVPTLEQSVPDVAQTRTPEIGASADGTAEIVEVKAPERLVEAKQPRASSRPPPPPEPRPPSRPPPPTEPARSSSRPPPPPAPLRSSSKPPPAASQEPVAAPASEPKTATVAAQEARDEAVAVAPSIFVQADIAETIERIATTSDDVRAPELVPASVDEVSALQATSAPLLPSPAPREASFRVVRDVPWRRIAAGVVMALAVPLLVALALMARNPREPELPAAPRPTIAPAPHPTFTQRANSEVVEDDAGAVTGALRMPTGVARAWVDGSPQNIANRTLILSCGPHTVKLPKRAPVRVIVPCGGTATY